MKKKNNISPMTLISKNDFVDDKDKDNLPKFKNPSSDFQYRKTADIDNTLLNYPSN
jgi:hypothetical protein